MVNINLVGKLFSCKLLNELCSNQKALIYDYNVTLWKGWKQLKIQQCNSIQPKVKVNKCYNIGNDDTSRLSPRRKQLTGILKEWTWKGLILEVIRRTWYSRVTVWSKQYQFVNIVYPLTWGLKTGTAIIGLKMSLMETTT